MSKTQALQEAEEDRVQSDPSWPDLSPLDDALSELCTLTKGFTTSPHPRMTSPKITNYALEERTLQFASNVRAFVKRLPRVIGSGEDVQQLLRAAAGVGVNYMEANEAPTKTEFVAHIRNCLKESKEATFWLRLIDTGASDSLKEFKDALVKESRDLMRIYFAILRKIRSRQKAA